jgi:hypothetical protein
VEHGFGDSPADGERAAYKRVMRSTPTPASGPSWDWTPLLVVGVAVGFLVPLLTGAGSTWVAPLGFVGLVALLTAVVRRSRGSNRTSTRPRAPEGVAGSLSWPV